MPARHYPYNLDRFADLRVPLRKGVRIPVTPPGAGLPPRVVRYLRDFGSHKQGGTKEIRWRIPGYQILSRQDLLRR